MACVEWEKGGKGENCVKTRGNECMFGVFFRCDVSDMN
jgi:hypothetical protein